MPAHPRARQAAAGPRQELPPAVGKSIPIIIFCTTLFIVYQVNHHRQLEDMITNTQRLHEDEHFVTGGRTSQEKDLRAHLGRAFGSGSQFNTGTGTGTDIPAGTDSALAQQASPASATTAESTVNLAGSSGSTAQQAGSTGTTTGVTTKADGSHNAGSRAQRAGSKKSQDLDAPAPAECHAEAHAEYHGSVVQWGTTHKVGSAGECCAACQKRAASDGCNIWVYCGEDDCGAKGQPHLRGECWLKKARLDEVIQHYMGKAHPGIKWTSGVLYSDADWAAHQARAAAKESAESTRLQALRDNASLPLVWMDISIKGKPVGRMEFVLFTHISPLAAENMRRMCTGEVSAKHTFKGATFYRIIDQFIDQTGVEVAPCALGGMFKDDRKGLELRHDRKGLLSVANMGHDTNTGHFSILQGPAPHLNGGYVIFGELVTGWEVAEAVNKLSRGQPNNELLGSRDAVITDVGQIRQGTPVPQEVIAAGLVDHTS